MTLRASLTSYAVPAAILLTLSALSSAEEPADAAQRLYAERATEFADLTPSFTRVTETARANKRGAAALQNEIKRLREAWKRMEFLVEYAHPGSAALLFPPPLEQANIAAPHSTEVLEPEGLQWLQELVFEEDDPWENRETLRRLAVRLEVSARNLVEDVTSVPLDDRMLFEAMQSQVIRVMTQGITGFDSPATQFSLPESHISLKAIRPVLDPYLPALRARDRDIATRLEESYETALRMLGDNPGFDDFDRLAFIREAANPLYAALVDAHHALNIATMDDYGIYMARPVSVTARNLFDKDFIDPHYYSLTPGDKMDTVVASLGRRLFFDELLSKNKHMSCATCHNPSLAFSDGQARSPSFGGGTVLRNSPGLSFSGWQGAQFWDMRVRTLEEQIHHVVEGADEFNIPFMEVLDRLNSHAEYPRLFKEAFPGDDDPVTVPTLSKALSMYMRSLGRWNSPFDRYVRGEAEWIDPAVKRGFNLFMGKADCATCHFPPTFNGMLPPFYLETETEVLGTPKIFPADILELSDDPGRIHFHAARIFLRSFKTPTVRNVELTAPYMHNGGMATLEDVMDFYNAGGGQGLGLDVPNQTLPPDSLGLTREEMDDIIVFMKALTDTTGYGAERGAAKFR